MNWVPWVMMPVLGGGIGWVTNWVAIKMLFHPRTPRLGLQGLLPRRQQELAASIGQVVGDELVRPDDLLKGLDGIDLVPHLAEPLDRAIAAKLEDLRKLPFIGGLVTPERIAGIRESVLAELVAAQPGIIAKLKAVARERLDVGRIARDNLAAFDLDRLETMVNRIASREFRAIEWWGLILGAVIGLVQAGVTVWLG
jgi:uncharacterized membrane protein YheB (UPF0754 family)